MHSETFYIPEESKVIYKSKDGKEEKIFDALEWLAAMCSHVPNKGESRRVGSGIMVITVPRLAGWPAANGKSRIRTA